MKFIIRVVLSVTVIVLLLEGLFTGLHLLNLPSNLAVAGGVALLLTLAVVSWLAFRSIWTDYSKYVSK